MSDDLTRTRRLAEHLEAMCYELDPTADYSLFRQTSDGRYKFEPLGDVPPPRSVEPEQFQLALWESRRRYLTHRLELLTERAAARAQVKRAARSGLARFGLDAKTVTALDQPAGRQARADERVTSDRESRRSILKRLRGEPA